VSPHTEPEAEPLLAQTNDRFYQVQVRPTDAFTEFQTPLAADATGASRQRGCDVREGRVGPGGWLVESVLVPVDAVDDGDAATDRTRRIVDDIES
jgi:hypothetical protein